MKDKLQLLIKSEEKITQSGLAEMLGIQPATITHIINGRNKPSYELLQKILVRFPNVSSDWLMLDRGEMLRDPSLTPSGMPRAGVIPDVVTDGGTGGVDLPASAAAGGAVARTAGAAESFRQSSIFDSLQNADSVRRPSAGLPSVPTDSPNARESNIFGGTDIASVLSQSHDGAHVERVVVFYSDKTFDTYIPKK